LIAGSVIDDEPFLDAEAGGAGQSAEFFAGKNVAPGCAWCFADIPSDHHVAMVFVPGHQIAEEAQGCF